MSDIEALRLRRDEAYGTYLRAETALKQALVAAYKWQPGDILKSNKGVLARVEKVSVRRDEVEIYSVLLKKDGTFGKREAPFWRDEWRNATLHSRATTEPKAPTP